MYLQNKRILFPSPPAHFHPLLPMNIPDRESSPKPDTQFHPSHFISCHPIAAERGHVRLRPILMTSFAFVLGVMPLLFATGAGAQSRIALGAAVVFGMAMNTLLATIYIPNFYEFMQKLQERFSKKKGNEDSEKDVAV